VSEWWSYRPGSFLLFSARTFYRLIDTYNVEVWPLQLAALAGGVGALLWLAREHSILRDRALFVMLAAAWLWLAWGFAYSRFAAINWAAPYVAGVYAAQGAALLWVGVVRGSVAFRQRPQPTDPAALVIVVAGLIAYPLIGAALGRPWSQAEVFGLMPEPTAIATLGFLLLAQPLPRGLFIVPVASCAYGGAMLWALHAREAWFAPALALVAIGCAWIDRRRLRGPHR
jgi:hypothetical protein